MYNYNDSMADGEIPSSRVSGARWARLRTGSRNSAASASIPALAADAVIFEGGGKVSTRTLSLQAPAETDVIVDVEWTGVSAGTERLLWSGDMPFFPGLEYPLVPGYEAVGRIVWVGENVENRIELFGRQVFAPGAQCFEGARGVFGAAASRLTLPAERVAPIDMKNPEDGVLLALASTAIHALRGGDPPDLIVGHGTLGRLLARATMALGAAAPVVWETDSHRKRGDGYSVLSADTDDRRDYGVIFDATGNIDLIDDLIARLRPRGELVLAGFYAKRPSFSFPPAFQREARLRIAAEWSPSDLRDAITLVETGKLSLDGLISHTFNASRADEAYRTAFEGGACRKARLDWRETQ